MKVKIIGFGGVARSGKDSAFKALQLAYPNVTFKRYAFADELKNEISDLVWQGFGVDIWNMSEEEKNALRPLLVGWGMAKRYINKDYWLNKVMAQINHESYEYDVAVITDVRFLNEAIAIQQNNGIVMHLSRILPTGAILPPANEEETVNDPLVKARSDISIIWETFNSSNTEENEKNTFNKMIPYLKNNLVSYSFYGGAVSRE